jgi:hypothetical protein
VRFSLCDAHYRLDRTCCTTRSIFWNSLSSCMWCVWYGMVWYGMVRLCYGSVLRVVLSGRGWVQSVSRLAAIQL